MSSFAEPTASASPPPTESSTRYMTSSAPAKGPGWILYSGVMLVLAGFLNLVDGLWAIDLSDSAAISDDVEAQLWYSDSLELWGWIYTILGVALIIVGIGVFSRRQLARWLGIGAASISAVVNMMWVFVYPIPALIHVVLACMVVYGLTTYGTEEGPGGF
jgi:cytochrome b subunit of formate dehydrogenase